MSHTHALAVIFAQATNVGCVRQNNEDSCAIYDLSHREEITAEDQTLGTGGRGILALVADGMGGACGGAIASKIARDNTLARMRDFTSFALPDNEKDIAYMLNKAMHSSHQAVLDETYRTPGLTGMGTTLTFLWLHGNHAYLCHIGDSRCYHLHNETMNLMTDDHSPVGKLISTGELTLEQARLHPQRNLLDQALGAGIYSIEPQFRAVPIQPGDQLLICSDGLSDALPHGRIQDILHEGATKLPSFVCTQLIAEARNQDGSDNITAVLLRINQHNRIK